MVFSRYFCIGAITADDFFGWGFWNGTNIVHDLIEFLFEVGKLVKKLPTEDSSGLKFWKWVSEIKLHYLLSLLVKFQTLAKHFLIWETKTPFDFLWEVFSFLFSTQLNLFIFYYFFKSSQISLKFYLLSVTPSNPYKFYKFICFMWFHQITISVSSCIIYFGVSILWHRTWWLAWKLHQWVSIFVLWVPKFQFFHYSYYHFVFIQLVVWFYQRSPFFLWFRSIFAFSTHFIFSPVTFLLDYSCLWLTSWVSFVVIYRFGLVWCIYKGQPCNSSVLVPLQILQQMGKKKLMSFLFVPFFHFPFLF